MGFVTTNSGSFFIHEDRPYYPLREEKVLAHYFGY